VRGASRAAAAQHEANPRPASGVFLLSADLRGMEKHDASEDAAEDPAEPAIAESRVVRRSRSQGRNHHAFLQRISA
jgi:hypothetical protein